MTEKTPEQLTASMLRKELFIVTTTPARGPGIQQLLSEHLDYQIRLEREGILFGAGPIFNEGEDVPLGGMIILRADSIDEARAIVEQDPLHINGLRTFKIQKWIMNEGSISVTLRYSDQTMVFE